MVYKVDNAVRNESEITSFSGSPAGGVSIDALIAGTLKLCKELPPHYGTWTDRIEELRERLAKGKLHFAVLGQFNRGKSTFINALLGMDVLPTSVLPLTNVPTIIRYGPARSCRISFFNGKADCTAGASDDAVRELLIQYVTEEKNPENRHCVFSVYVECPGELLHNGSELIDTPGFGSTFVHNTRTTIDLLSECDAAFFLLSADLPITEVEIEFLRQMRKYVPRIFFVFNKIDLLNESEREKTTKFVRSEIRRHLKFYAGISLFPVNAKAARSASSRTGDDPLWKQSGMTAVIDAINHFMVADKYFILSHALNEKFHDALHGIITSLDSEITDISEPVGALNQTVLLLKEKLGSIEKQTRAETGLIHAEQNALVDFLSTTVKKEQRGLQEQTERFFYETLNRKNVHGKIKDRLLASFPSFFTQALKNFTLQVTTAVNRPLRKASLVHRREFEKISAESHGLLGTEFALPDSVQDTLEGLEIAPPYESIPSNPPLSSADLKSVFGERFKRHDSLCKAYETCAFPKLKHCMDTAVENISQAVEKRIAQVCETLGAELENSYDCLKQAAAGKLEEKESLWNAAQEKARPRVEKKEDLKEEFEKFKGMLP
ncbi:MAG: hypothetical protein GF350_00675 [Chitinivibrionales bacterium]|nr:hypothetical protein [Chitinivibrionales bacterium]